MTQFWAAMEARGLTLEDIAPRCGKNTRASLACRISNRRLFPTLAAQLEAALDYVPLWSDPVEVAARQRCLRAFGVDPRLIQGPEAAALCKRLGVHSLEYRYRSREAYCSSIFAWLAANPRVGLVENQGVSPSQKIQ